MVESSDVPEPAVKKSPSVRLFFHFVLLLAILMSWLSQGSNKRAEVRLLEFEDVPGMLTDSNSFRKAKAAISKASENKAKRQKLDANKRPGMSFPLLL